jgi:hypothetical protein
MRDPLRSRRVRRERGGEDAELARLRDGDVEARGDLTQDRRERQDARLAC